MKNIPYARQSIDQQDIRLVSKILRSDWITQGPMVEKFERALANYCGAKYAVAVSSGTAALHLACLVAGLKKGDEAITTPITFLATPNSILYTGAKPVFADIDYDTVNIDPEKIKAVISKRTKAILPVHFAGLPCDMAKIDKIAKSNSIIVIEDACHALGAKYKCGKKWIKVGSCKHSDMTVFSFHPVKHITTGEGGVITTNNRNYYQRLKALRSHGVYKNAEITREKGLWYYEMRELGFNYRITDFACALGLSQLKKLNLFVEKRKKIALFYDLSITGIDRQSDATHNKKHAYHLYVIKIDFKKHDLDRRAFINKMKKSGIDTQVHYIPVYRQPYYKKAFHISPNVYPNAEKYYKRTVSIPIFFNMSSAEIRYVAKAITKALIS